MPSYERTGLGISLVPQSAGGIPTPARSPIDRARTATSLQPKSARGWLGSRVLACPAEAETRQQLRFRRPRARVQASCAFPDPPWLWSASCIARRMRTWGSLAPARRRYRQFRHISAAPFALSVSAGQGRGRSRAPRASGAPVRLSYPDEVAEAEAQGLPYALLPRILSRREYDDMESSPRPRRVLERSPPEASPGDQSPYRLV